MKIFSIFTILVCTACASPYVKNYDYSDIKDIKINQTKEQDILKKYGKPFLVHAEKNADVLLFKSSSSGFHKLSIKIAKDSRLVKELTWIPSLKDKELDLENAKNRFPNSRFINVTGETKYHEALPTEASLIDNENGVSLVYYLKNKTVQAIIVSEVQERTPADIRK